MRINIKATNFELTAAIKSHVEEKFGALDKYFDNIQGVDIELGLITKGQQKGKIYFCEANVAVPKKLLRFRKEYDNMMKAVSDVKKGIQNEIQKYKEMLRG